MPMCNKFTMKMLRRKPSKWGLFDGHLAHAYVEKTGETARSRRWRLQPLDVTLEHSGGPRYFRSRRAAVHYFVTGEKFETSPVFAVVGGRRSQKRVR